MAQLPLPPAAHPRDVLRGAQAAQAALPVCDHYSGVEPRMRKSLQLQADLMAEYGACVLDVTLDCEDGAPVGAEAEHAALVAELLQEASPEARVGVRVHPVDHPAFEVDVQCLLGQGRRLPAYAMVPKVESVACVERMVAACDAVGATDVPIHVLIESPAAVHRCFDIAAHPRVQSLSFGLMDFVSAHAGAIPASAMGVVGQFEHPLVLRAKLALASAAHAHGKVPSHCVVTEFRDLSALRHAALKARNELGYTRMWSIHPDQVRTVIEVFAPSEAEIDEATQVIAAAWRQQWAPIQVNGRLHDRASYRFYWQILERAHQTGRVLPAEVGVFFAPKTLEASSARKTCP
ncbi:MAG: aldolase/citrate lyase family protein [Burkholderiaceae bacterium]|nr:aldolase/citrate lyase family protein [Burkholderiaceae bacterium]